MKISVAKLSRQKHQLIYSYSLRPASNLSQNMCRIALYLSPSALKIITCTGDLSCYRTSGHYHNFKSYYKSSCSINSPTAPSPWFLQAAVVSAGRA